MSSYQLADGFDNEAGFTAVDPQPATTGIDYPERMYAADGTPKAKGAPFVIWRYHKEITETQYASLLSQFGLTTALYNEVTIKTVGEDRTTWSNYNGIIIKPHNPKYQMGFYRDVEFVIKLLETT